LNGANVKAEFYFFLNKNSKSNLPDLTEMTRGDWKDVGEIMPGCSNSFFFVNALQNFKKRVV